MPGMSRCVFTDRHRSDVVSDTSSVCRIPYLRLSHRLPPFRAIDLLGDVRGGAGRRQTFYNETHPLDGQLRVNYCGG